MDLQQVLQALENADRAGDKAAAQELANLARQYQGGGMELDIPTFALPAAPPPPPPEGGFIPAVQRGFMQTGILLGDILPAMAGRAIGANEYAERQFREAAETEKKIQEKYAPAVASYKDVKGVGDAITYAVESVGELVPSILPSLFTGGLAGVLGRGAVIAAKEAAETAARKQIAEKGVQALTEKEVMDQIRKAGIDAASRTAMKYQALGAVGGSSLQNIPEVYKNIKDETEEESLGSAMLFGGLNSLLDAALPLSLLAKARKAGIPGEEIVGAWYKRFGVGAAKGFATEGATEAAQEMSSAAAEKFVDNNIDFFSEKNLERFINAGLKGGLGGGVISGATDVMLGKKSLTEENKPLDQDIRDAQTDILARRALLDELRAQAAEEGRNKLDADSLKDLGFGPKYSLYGSLLNKDINDPVQAAEVISTLEAAVADPATKGRERVVASNTLEVINQYLETRGEPDVGQVVEEPSGAGIPVPTEAVTPPPAEGVGGVERTGVVPPVADVGAPVGGEGLQPAPVEAPVFAAPEPSQLPPVEPERLPTTGELITEQETQLAKDMERFQNLLQQQVRRFGLNDVAVQVDADLREADGQYTKGLIKLAVDAADPVRALRHESIHAMKELGFFTPSQWNALVNRANESWINTYLQNRNVDGGFIEPGQTSRYDAYLKLFKDQGLNDAQIQEAMVEEAISDAFGDFSQTQAPPGMMRAILNRMKNFFKAIKETVSGSGVTDPERLFGKIEKGEVAAPLKPVSEVAAPPEQKTEAPKAEAPKAEVQPEEAPARYSLRGEVPLSTRAIMEANDEFARADLGLNIKPKKGIANKVRDIGIALNEQTKREQGTMDRQKLTIENEKAIASAIADEVAYQLTAGQRKTGTGLGWYSNNYPRAVKRLGDRFPELATNRHARSVFTALVAVTSNGEKVTKNIDNAITLYEKLRDGKPMFAMGNRRATALINNLQVIQDLLAKHGTDFEKVLLQEITVKDMNAQLRAMGQKSDGSYLANTRVPAAAVYFGPKLGAFYANLSGSEGYLTMDLWWTRSINRMRGLLLPKATDASIDKLRDMIGDDSMTRDDLVAATVPLRNKYEEFGFTTELEHLVKKKEPSTKGAKPAWFAKAKRAAGPAYDQLLYDHNLEKMANTIYKNEFEGLEEAPFTATDRAFMYRAGRRAQALLRAEGIDLTLADIQAALWYYEKRLYEKLSGKKADDIGYEEAILAQADQADRRAGPSVVFPERDGRGAVATGEVAGATEVRGEPAEARAEEVTPPKYSISGKRITDTPELREAARQSAIVDAQGNLIPMYHGTAAFFRIFRPKQAGATFVSPDPNFASGFTSASRNWMVRHIGQFLTPEEIRKAVQELRQTVYADYGKQSKMTTKIMDEIHDVLLDAKETGVYNFTGELEDRWQPIAYGMIPGAKERVLELYVLAKKPFDYANKDHVAQVIKKLIADPEVKEKYGFDPAPGIDLKKPENFMLRKTLERSDKDYRAAVGDRYRNLLLNGDWSVIETPEVQRAIRGLDFDSFYVSEGRVKNLGVYDPKLIKSADENVGPFGQRPPTEEEAARVGMEPAEALKAQEEGDIRFSLRAHKDLFDRADEIPMSEGVEAIRDDWVGGVAGVGNRDSMYELFRIEGGPAYTGEVQKFLRNNLGENFKGYRLMSQGEFEELTTGSMGSQFVSFSLNPDVAKGFKNLPAYAKRKDLVVVEMDLTPEHVHMIGHPGEQELVVDYGQGYNPAEVKVVEGDIERKSLRSKPFDPDSLPTNNKEYTLPQNTILYHGAYETIADAIQSVGYLTSRPKIKAHGGLTNEGGLVWFGSKETAQKYADSEADPGKVRFDREAGIIREPGKVFEAITDQPYKLISRYRVLSAKEANALNEALGLPDYKRLKAGDGADTAAYRANDYKASKAERFEIQSGKYTQTISSPWPIILKTLNADGFYSDGTVALTAENGIRLSEEGRPMERFSLRSQIDPAINARIVQTTTTREEKSFPQRITDAIAPENWSRFRAAALNRYNRLGEYDKMRIKQMGGAELLADSNAESAALMSDLHAGIVAGSLGVYDKVGGVPVYNRHYVVERTVQTPTGPRTILVGGKISNRNTAEALARRYPNSKVKERGYTAVSNLNNTIKGPIAIFAPLAKLGDPYAYQAYQYWAGVKRGSKWVTQTQGPQKGQVVEQLFNDPKDKAKAEELRKKFLNDYKIDFNQIQKEWIDYNDQLVQYMLDTGVISKESAKKFKDHGDYIPFYRQINGDDDAVGPRVFQSIAAVKAPRKIKGGEDPLGDFLENVVRNTQAAVQAGMKNVASRRAADVGTDLGFVSPVTQAQADPVNSFYVMENGQKVFYDSSDPLLIDSIKSLGMSEFPGIGLLAGPAGVLRNLVTKDPGFMLANMMRDSLAAWTTSGVNMLPIAATLKNFTEALAGTSPEFKTLLMSGVVGGYDYSQGTVDAAKQFGKELRKTAGARTIGEKAMSPFTSLWEGLEKGTQASDAATRIEVYKQTLRETGNEAEALFRALEVMNFNRKGNNPIVRVATAAIPFLNARMQGLDVLYRAGLGKNATANAQEIQKAFWRRGMYMAALSTMYWALTHDDEEYKKQEQETKDNNWLFPSAGVRVPIPFEVGVLFKVIPERIAALIFGDDSAKDFTASMVRNLTSTLAVNPIPQTLLPLVEATTNFSFFTFRPIVGQGLEGVAAPYQIGPSTSRAGQLLAEMSKGLPSALQISPMKADAVIQGYTGTIGTYMSQLFDAVYDMHTDNPKASLRFEQLPVVKRFILDPDARGQVTAYFDLKNSVDEATRTSNLLERSMNFKEWGEYYSQNLGLFAVKDYILDMDKTLKEYRDMKNMIRTLPMGADQKRDSILAITRIENQLNANIELLKKQAGK